MKTKHLYSASIFILVCVSLSSCVSKGKFLAANSHINALASDSASTHQSLNDCNSKVAKLTDDYNVLRAKNSATQNDLQNTQNNLEDVTNKTNLTIAQQAKRLKDLQDLIQSQRNVMNRLKKSIADALVNFKPDELTVSIKDGNVYVSLQEKLLFKSGSAVVDAKGKEALGTLAAVLNSTPDISVNIEGHTDTVPMRSEKFEDNWALSTGRAASIVRILTKDYQVDPHRIIASGRGEFHPITSNETADGKKTNRRTEIILSPNLSELYKLLGQ